MNLQVFYVCDENQTIIDFGNLYIRIYPDLYKRCIVEIHARQINYTMQVDMQYPMFINKVEPFIKYIVDHLKQKEVINIAQLIKNGFWSLKDC